METTYTVTVTFANKGSCERSFKSLFAAVAYAEELKDARDIEKIVINELAVYDAENSDEAGKAVLSVWTRTANGWKYGFK